MTTTVLFDLFGVLARLQSEQGKDRLVRAAGMPAPEFWDAYWKYRPRYDSGKLTGQAYWQHVIGSRLDQSRTAALVQADIASWSAVDDSMVALVAELADAGRRIALLSNVPEELAAHYEAHHSWLGYFEVRAFSCRIGHIKPDPDAFLWCRDALGQDAGSILFVDDRRDNVQAAETIGMHGHLFTTPAGLRSRLAR